MKVSHKLNNGQDMVVEITEDGIIIVYNVTQVMVRMEYGFGTEGNVSSVQKGMLEVSVKPAGVEGFAEVVMTDQSGAILPRTRPSLAMHVKEDHGKCFVVVRDGVGDWTREHTFPF
jgi:hypothetical protein